MWQPTKAQKLIKKRAFFFLKKMFSGTLSLTQENHLMSLNMTKHICCHDTPHKT
jgi:hypothetical protein